MNFERVINGDIRSAARLIRDIEDEIPTAREELKKIYPHTGRAYILGITGSPGTGKSTLVDKLVKAFREQEKTVGVIAVDPQRAVELEPNLSFAYTWLGSALMYEGRPEEAITVYEKAIRLNPFPPDYYLRDLGEAYRMAGRYEEAIATLKKIIQSNPDHLEAHVGMACVYSILDRHDDARAAAMEVRRIHPDFSLKDNIKRYPYKNPTDLDTLIEALHKVGLK